MPDTGSFPPVQAEPERRRSLRRRRDFTLIITNAAKVTGLVLGTIEAASDHPNKVSLIFFGFLILGVQRAEELALNAIDRFLGR